MKKNTGLFFIIIIFILVLILVLKFIQCSKWNESLLIVSEENESQTKEKTITNGGSHILQTVAEGLEIPWSMVFTQENRLLLTERPGRVRVIKNGILQKEPLYVFDEVVAEGEGGLMGLAIDSGYKENKFVYMSLTYIQNETPFVKVVRLRDEENSLEEEKTIFDHIPAAQYHVGNRLVFGPDEKLYITTGDALQASEAQNLDSLAGKILRINADGSIPEDNPFPGSPVWSYGHRNPQGLAFNPSNGLLYESEHGPSGFDGPEGGDEINLIQKGENYGWPLVSHKKTLTGTKAPLVFFTPAKAPASLLFYIGQTMPVFTNHLLFGALRGEGIVGIKLDQNNPTKIVSSQILSDVHEGRIRTVIQGPDECIYFSTSNRDGRGEPKPEDDRILRLCPK